MKLALSLQVLVKVHSVGVNPLESLIRMGVMYKPSLPYTPGTDAAGEVTDVGEGVTSVKVSALWYFTIIN